jgi:hypothetical protein
VWIRIQVYLIAEISDVVQTRVVVDETQWDDERRQPALVVDDGGGEVAAGCGGQQAAEIARGVLKHVNMAARVTIVVSAVVNARP